jgi:transcriptional regulator with XRE-family HTH domain
MSSNNLHESSNTLDVQCVTCFVVRSGREAVAGYVEQELAGRGWSYGEVVRRSGGYIRSASTLVNVVNGNVQKVSEDTLLGLATAFKVPRDFVFSLYHGNPVAPGDERGEYQRRRELLLWMFDDLPEECQLDVLASVAGVHERRSMAAKIHERHGARAEARNIIKEKFDERDAALPGNVPRHPAVTDTPPDVPLPETTPQVSDDEAEGEDWPNGSVKRKNGTNREES